MNKLKSQKGFSLPEVMIGIFVLTVAVVAATNLLISLLTANQANVKSLQAYYLAQEGLEAVRNIRDTNWLHNQNWLQGVEPGFWGADLALPAQGAVNNYEIAWQRNGFFQGTDAGSDLEINLLKAHNPWLVSAVVADPTFDNLSPIYLDEDQDMFSSAIPADDSGFRRIISLENYDCELAEICLSPDEQDDFVLVKSEVFFKVGSKERSLVLTELLTNWKKGAI